MFTVQTATNTFLANLSALENRINKSNRQVSSGLTIQTVSDAPALVAEILEVNASISKNNQIRNNLGQAQTEVNAAEGAINSATTILDQATQLATEGSNGTATNRTQLANQVQDLLTQLQQLSASQVSGRFLFSGSSDQVAPYGPVDLTANPTNAVGSYQASTSTRSLEDPSGVNFSISFTAQYVFDGGTSGTPANSAFQSLTQLYNALVSGDQSAVNTAAGNIRSASDYVSGMQARYGDIQNKISDALTSQVARDTTLTAQLSDLQDADAAQAITQQQTDSTALQAAEAAYASLPRKSLFDYLG